ncbi:MAG: helix-turn-helix domain-containing protein [Runella sp.]
MSNLQNLANLAIEKLRKEKKLSREDMAHHLDISLEAYRKIENGTTKLSLDRLSQICEVLETDILKLLTPENEKYRVQEVKDKAIGINTGTVNHTQDKILENRLSQLEESVRLLTLLVHRFLGEEKNSDNQT